MGRKVYVVMAERGEYDYSEAYLVRSYFNQASAEEFVRTATALGAELKRARRSDNPLDPQFRSTWPSTYSVVETELADDTTDLIVMPTWRLTCAYEDGDQTRVDVWHVESTAPAGDVAAQFFTPEQREKYVEIRCEPVPTMRAPDPERRVPIPLDVAPLLPVGANVASEE